MVFEWLKKKPIERVEGREIEIKTDTKEEDITKKAIEKSEEQIKDQEKREKINRFISRISAIMERIELLERKMDRVESRLGIKDEAKRSEEKK
ncbi:MAG: hypothetical protein QW041_02720 [Candidatus Pacearchaeota archaeon]